LLFTERTMAFQFEKPANFIFRAGQWIDITLLNPAETDAEGDVREFSVASAPYEDVLMVATRMRDTAFKRELAKMPLNTELKIAGPGGDLALHNDPARTAVFLAGGIGVTSKPISLSRNKRCDVCMRPEEAASGLDREPIY
jgi:ferredoxin-NADP reductase